MNLVIVGSDSKQCEQQIDQFVLKNKLIECDRIKFDGNSSDFSFDDFYYETSSASLFYEGKVICLYNPVFLTTKATLPSSMQQQWLQLFEQGSQSNHLVIVFQQVKPDRKKAIAKACLANSRLVELDEIDGKDIDALLKNYFKQKQIVLSDSLFQEIVTNIPDYSSYCAFIEKVDLLPIPVEVALLKYLLSSQQERIIFDLSNAIVENRIQDMFKIYYQLKEQKVDSSAIIYILSGKLRQAVQCRLMKSLGYLNADIAKQLGISEKFVWFLINRQLSNFSMQRSLATLKELQKLDTQIKTSQIDRELGFELWLMKQGEKHGKSQRTL